MDIKEAYDNPTSFNKMMVGLDLATDLLSGGFGKLAAKPLGKATLREAVKYSTHNVPQVIARKHNPIARKIGYGIGKYMTITGDKLLNYLQNNKSNILPEVTITAKAPYNNIKPFKDNKL